MKEIQNPWLLNNIATQFGLQNPCCPVIIGGSNEETASFLDDLKGSTDALFVPIVPRVGMACIVKTTVAKLVYNHVQVRRQFDVKFWICALDDFDVQRILRQKRPSKKNSMLKMLEKKLKGKK